MLDHPWKTQQLLEDLRNALPAEVHVSKAVRDKLTQRTPGALLPEAARVVEVQYFDDDTGIMCVLDFGPGTMGAVYMYAISYRRA